MCVSEVRWRRKKIKNKNANTEEKSKDHGRLCVCEVSWRGKKIQTKRQAQKRRKSQKNLVVWRRNKKSRYIGEEWVCVWRRKNKKEKRKREKETCLTFQGLLSEIHLVLNWKREMEVVQVLHMNKGAGETSYAKNSKVQVRLIGFLYLNHYIFSMNLIFK